MAPSAQVVTVSGDSTAKLWDTHDGACALTLEGHSDWVRSAAFSPDGRLVATASKDTTARPRRVGRRGAGAPARGRLAPPRRGGDAGKGVPGLTPLAWDEGASGRGGTGSGAWSATQSAVLPGCRGSCFWVEGLGVLLRRVGEERARAGGRNDQPSDGVHQSWRA